jgi:hypothetical protein
MKRKQSSKRVSSVVKCLFLLGFSLPTVYAGPLVLNIEASNRNGTQIGTFIGLEVKKKFPDVEKKYDRYLAFLLSPPQFKQLLPQITALKAVVDPAYQDEVNGIAAAWQLNALNMLGDDKLSVDEFWLLQLLPDLTTINKGSAFAVANRSDKNPIAARNLDWKSTADLKSLQTITVYHYQDDRTLVSIGFAGVVSVISGFNDQGLFVSQLDASELQTSSSLLPQHASGFELRNTLKNQDRIVPATQELARKIYPRSYQVLLADPEDIAILEQPAGKIGRLRQIDSMTVNNRGQSNNQQLAAVNCFVLKDSPRNCYTSTNYYQLGRFAQLAKTFAGQNLSVSDVVTLMQDQANIHQAIFNENTLQSIVFTPRDRVLYFSTPALTKTNEKLLVPEKYQFIKTHRSSSNDKRIEMALLVLGVGVVGVGAGFYFSRWQKNKGSLSSK